MADSRYSLPLRKRRRSALSCIECRRRKIKCDRNSPCSHCKQSRGITCVYNGHGRPSAAESNATSTLVAPLQVVSQGQGIYSTSSHPEKHSVTSGQSSSYTTPITVNSSDSERRRDSLPRTQDNNTLLPQSVHCTLTPGDSVGTKQPDGIAMNVNAHVIGHRTATGENEESGVAYETHGDFLALNNVIVGGSHTVSLLRTKFFNPSSGIPPHDSKASIRSMRFYGQSHWKHSLKQFDNILTSEGLNHLDCGQGSDQIHNIMHKCKAMIRKAKAEVPNFCNLKPQVQQDFPERDVADRLVQNYFRTMEGTYRILHTQSFYHEYEQYWKDPLRAAPPSVMKILLTMAIGSCFYQDEKSGSLRARAQQWVAAAQTWVSVPLEKARLNVSVLQVHCLLLLARQTNAVGGDLTWISAGSLLRTAFIIGLHRDPKYFPRISTLQSELRRRLWATVLEMTIQTSLDSGMPPLISMNDFDTKSPSNVDDEDLCEGMTEELIPKPMHLFTQTSIQIQLLKSLPTRYQIARQINDFQSGASYDDILRLGTEMNMACNENTMRMNEYTSSMPRPTMLQRNLLDLTTRRFLLAVHRPFAIKSKEDPRYYFSRKVCLDTALIIASHTSSSSRDPPPLPGKTDDYTRLRTVGSGFYKEITIYAGVLVGIELSMQLEEEAASGLPPTRSAAIARAPLHKVLREIVELSAARVQFGDNGVREYIFLSAVMAKMEALEKGTDPKHAMREMAQLSAQNYLEMIKARTNQAETPSDISDLHDTGELAEQLTLEQDFPHDFMLQDGSLYFDTDMLGSWHLDSWEENSPW
ncbi:hypothetical protein BP6252_13813 [Coleophoma cylindrospora]|uniref:Zn(2)-C6 fungal-type domain-containing protein n=1 Tax=Coleophoma cylindrospora TaxID=1849047 RepID=A0A3D8Q5P3_9HELO|nr:hypothetical protein BP6252_13813 [Coleophoma cylindrospora]